MLRRTIAAATAALVAIIPVFAPASANAEDPYCFTHDLPPWIATRDLDEPMKYYAVEGNGRVIVQAIGAIGRNESQHLAAFLDNWPQADEIWFHSPGGVAAEGPKMGRVIRKLGLLTRVRKGAACVSACTYAFLGGVVRIVEQGGYYGVHMFTATRSTDMMLKMMGKMADVARLREILLRRGADRQKVDRQVTDIIGDVFQEWEQMSALLAADQAKYLAEMSLSLEFMTSTFGQEANGVCYLSVKGLQRYNVTNASAATPAEPAPAPSAPAATAPAPSPATTTARP